MSDAETEFVDRHRALVQSIVQSVQRQLPYAIDTADLEAFGFIGLLEARSRYDASRGAQFTTFAYYRIRGAIIDGIGKMARVPRSVVRRAQALSVLDAESENAAESRAQASHPDPKAAAIDSLSEVLSRAATAFTLAALASQPASPEENAAHNQSMDAVRKATLTLPERERMVIQAHYIDDRNLDEIGKELGLSKSWMSRLHAKALDQLRAALTGDE